MSKMPNLDNKPRIKLLEEKVSNLSNELWKMNNRLEKQTDRISELEVELRRYTINAQGDIVDSSTH